ncbi:MAG: LysM peptidoglycan-binding domain-containing protein [Caldilineaceae bacterium]|nr:LysM peptidoglycan-binding domain-containing protein [Caldilineaceae bacterium]
MGSMVRRLSGHSLEFWVLLAIVLLLAVSGKVAAQTDLPSTPGEDSSSLGIETTIYIVQSGDTLTSIARRYATSVTLLQQLNSIGNANQIFVGQRLVIPQSPREPLPLPTLTPTPISTPEIESLPMWTASAEVIEIFSPVERGYYHSPIQVNGFLNAIQGELLIRLLDAEGNILAERNGMGATMHGINFIQTYLRFVVEEETPARLVAFWIRGRDGATVEIEIPVVLLPGQRAVDLLNPQPGELVCAGIFLDGYATATEGEVVVTIEERDGAFVKSEKAPAGRPNFYAAFRKTIPVDVEVVRPLLISVHSPGANGERIIDRTRLPIIPVSADSSFCAQSTE